MKFVYVEFTYTVNADLEVPVMALIGEIGVDVIGSVFARELMFLDTLGKSRIAIWINSNGGSIMDSDTIIGAILKTKTKVDTHNIGLCASSAGAIFLAGCNRYMMDYAKFMIHGVSGASDYGSHKAFSEGILKNLTTRCKLTKDEAKIFMSTETWLNAKECEGYGIATMEDSGDYNKPHVSKQYQNWTDFSNIVNKLIDDKKPKTMSNFKNITNKLGLIEDANESSILTKIGEIENRATTAEGKLKTQEAENKAKLDAKDTEIKTLTDAKNAWEAEKKTATDKAEADKKALAVTESKDTVANYVKLGKITNKAEVIASAEELYQESPEKFKKLFGEMPVNKKAPVIDPAKPAPTDNYVPIDNENPQVFVARMNAKNFVKAQNRFPG